MKKYLDIKATKLMIDDYIKIADVKYRVTNLTKNFGHGQDGVCIHLYDDKNNRCITMKTPARTRFNVFK